MRILLIHPHLNFYGGSERLTGILVGELARKGHEVTVVTHSRAPQWFPDVGEARYVDLRPRVERRTGIEHLDYFVGAVESIAQAVRLAEPEAALATIQEPAYLLAVKLAVPTMGTAMYIHFPVEEELTRENVPLFLRNFRFPGLYEVFYGVPEVVMVNSRYTAAALYDMFDVRPDVVYPTIAWPFYTSIPDLKRHRDNVVLSVGRFVPQKRFDVLIEMFRARIKPVVPDARLVIVGTYDERNAWYMDRVKSLADSTKDVELYDTVLPDAKLVQLYQEAKVYVHMRIGEHFGMAPLEAMAQGAIAVVSRSSGLVEVINDGEEALTAGTDEEYASAILRVLRMGNDELSEMRQKARMKAWLFNPDRFANEILANLEVARVKARRRSPLFERLDR